MGNPDGVIDILIFTPFPWLHQGLFTENSYGVYQKINFMFLNCMLPIPHGIDISNRL